MSLPAPDAAALRQPPHHAEAESAVLGAILLDSRALALLEGELRADHFYYDRHRILFAAMEAMSARSVAIDPVTLEEELVRSGMLQAVGGALAILEIRDSTPAAANVRWYADIVRRDAVRRRLIAFGAELAERAYDPSVEIAEIVDDAEQQIFELTTQRIAPPASAGDHLRRSFDAIFSRQRGGLSGVSTGYYGLDDLTNGFQRSSLVLIAARPSMGKTSLGLNIADQIGTVQRVPTLFFSLEVGAQDLCEKLLCMKGDVNMHDLRRGRVSQAEFTRLSRALETISQSRLFIDATANIDITDIRGICRRMVMEHQVRVIFIDYLSLIGLPPTKANDPRQEQVRYLSQSLKHLARELEITVVALAQLNRDVEKRGGAEGGNRPRMSDLRESGALEQDADLIMLIHRPEYYGQAGPGGAEGGGSGDRDGVDGGFAGSELPPGYTEIIVAKNRNGPTGTAPLQFVKETGKFVNPARQMQRT